LPDRAEARPLCARQRLQVLGRKQKISHAKRPSFREMFGAVAAGGAVRTAQPITEECGWFTCVAVTAASIGKRTSPDVPTVPQIRSSRFRGRQQARTAIQQRGTSDPPPLVSAVPPRAISGTSRYR
jgi:hypothetical protein